MGSDRCRHYILDLWVLCQLCVPSYRAVTSKPAKQFHMGHYGVVVQDGEERRLRVHNNVPHAFFVALSREDKVDAFPMQDAVCGLLKNVSTRARS